MSSTEDIPAGQPVYFSKTGFAGGFVAIWIGRTTPPVWRDDDALESVTYNFRLRAGYSLEQLVRNCADSFLKGAPYTLHELPTRFANAVRSGGFPVTPKERKERARLMDEQMKAFWAGRALGETDPCWTVLGVDASAGVAEIRTAFRRLALAHHPDHGGDAGAFIRVKAAYDMALARARMLEYSDAPLAAAE